MIHLNEQFAQPSWFLFLLFNFRKATQIGSVLRIDSNLDELVYIHMYMYVCR